MATINSLPPELFDAVLDIKNFRRYEGDYASLRLVNKRFSNSIIARTIFRKLTIHSSQITVSQAKYYCNINRIYINPNLARLRYIVSVPHLACLVRSYVFFLGHPHINAPADRESFHISSITMKDTPLLLSKLPNLDSISLKLPDRNYMHHYYCTMSPRVPTIRQAPRGPEIFWSLLLALSYRVQKTNAADEAPLRAIQSFHVDSLDHDACKVSDSLIRTFRSGLAALRNFSCVLVSEGDSARVDEKRWHRKMFAKALRSMVGLEKLQIRMHETHPHCRSLFQFQDLFFEYEEKTGKNGTVDVVKGCHHWPKLREVELEKTVFEYEHLTEFMELHRNTLKKVTLKECLFAPTAVVEGRVEGQKGWAQLMRFVKTTMMGCFELESEVLEFVREKETSEEASMGEMLAMWDTENFGF